MAVTEDDDNMELSSANWLCHCKTNKYHSLCQWYMNVIVTRSKSRLFFGHS
jgi:hypothetical protein